ncbi:hypothetical protein GCM10022377_25180 [Zhihengliuella alba]|uniref:Branched-chain amino acid ABC transporter permease n=1 Tax=Zhihengliuella alba TaxID=547018 RepID=A0ABP7DWR6_9MICC
MSTPTLTTAPAGMQAFERTTSRWGRLTMLAGLILSLAGPLYVALFMDVGVTVGHIVTAYTAVAATFLVFAVVEPVTYFPILGQAAMYQAFMIGNISNKLLPAAICAQSRIDARPGTRQGDLAAVMGICGAALVHLTSLLIFVGVFGTWLLSAIPEPVIEVARIYILPAIVGAVLVQAIAAVGQLRPTLIALGVAVVVVFGIIPAFPALTYFGTAFGVVGTVLIAWFARKRA